MACEESASEGRVGNDCDAELAACAQQVDLRLLDVDAEGRVLHLDGVDVVHLAGAAEGRGRDFREPEVLDLALAVRCVSSGIRDADREEGGGRNTLLQLD